MQSALSRMQRNLRSLESTHSRMRGGSGRSRASILAALDANDCRAPAKSKEMVVASREPGLFARIFGGGSDERFKAREARRQQMAALNAQREQNASNIKRVRSEKSDGRDRIVSEGGKGFGPAGSLRTFCVRTCDGYYFPMSPSSSKSELDRDQNNCEAACPGAEMQVYYHDSDQEDAELMVSRASGRTYGNLPTAFAYRINLGAKDPQCSCNARPGALQLAAKPQMRVITRDATTGDVVKAPTSAAMNALRSTLPIPSPKPDQGADPETIANNAAGFGADGVSSLLSKDGQIAVNGRNIRVVGPVFLPDPTGAEAQQVPGQTDVQ